MARSYNVDGRETGLSPGRYLIQHHHRPRGRQNRQSRLRLQAVERSEVVETTVESGVGHAGVELGEQQDFGRGATVLSLTDVHTVTDVVADDELRPTADALGREGQRANDAASASALRWGAMTASPAAATAVVEAAPGVGAAAAGVEAAEMVVLGAPSGVGAAEGFVLEATAVAAVEEAVVVAAGEGVAVAAGAAAVVNEAAGVVVEEGVIAGQVVVAAAVARHGEGGRRGEDAGQEQEKEQEREDERFMRMALRLAERAEKAGEVPVCACLCVYVCCSCFLCFWSFFFFTVRIATPLTRRHPLVAYQVQITRQNTCMDT